MKVLFVIESLTDGGAERVTALLASAFAEKYDVIMCCYEKSDKEYALSSKIRRYYKSGYEKNKIVRRLSECRFLYHIIKKEKPNIIVSLSGYPTNLTLELANVLNGIPIILSERNDPGHYPAKTKGKILRNISYYLCDGIVFQTKMAKSYFDRRIQKKSVIIMNPVREDYAYREDIIHHKIVNCSRLTSQKNLDMLIDGFSVLVKEYSDFELHIYGDGEEREHLLYKISKLGLTEKVILHGFVEDVHEHIKDAYMYVSTSDYEGMSNSMLEAMVMGLPVVCTDCPAGGARMVIKNEKNGILIPVGDRTALVAAMKKLIENPLYAMEIGRKASMIKDYLSKDKIVVCWEKIVKKKAKD